MSLVVSFLVNVENVASNSALHISFKLFVGAAVGMAVLGLAVGDLDCVGAIEGLPRIFLVGCCVGILVGSLLGDCDGCEVGSLLG